MLDKMPRYHSPAPLREIDPFDGILIVDKPAGPTSHDIVAMIRRQFKFKKVGHGGTLDPQATGLLPILIGKGTKLSDKFLTSDKAYTGRIKLGVTTDSFDAEGDIVKEADCNSVTEEQLTAEMDKLTGDIYQTPPMVSAVKVDGVALYKHARKGKTVERKPRLIHIYEFTMLSFSLPTAEFLVRCTKGTYVRSLCYDIGEALGCGAHLEQLTRTQSGVHTLEDATAFDEIMNMTREQLQKLIIPAHLFANKPV